MSSKSKQVKLNNYYSVDTNPNENYLKISTSERSLVENYINDTFPDSRNEIELSKICSNFFYQSYAIVINNKKLLLKISLDPDNQKLSIEKNSLECIPDILTPKIISYTKKDEDGIEFLLTTWENGESFDIFGVNDLIYNFGTLCAVIDGVHETENNNAIDFKKKFLQNESVLSIFETMDNKDILIFEKLVDLNIFDLKKIFIKIKENYLPQYKEDVSVLSHGNIKKSNVLYLSGYIKLINFENSFKCDLYYSLFKNITDLDLYYNEKTVKNFLTKYYKMSKILGDLNLDEFLSKYEEKKKLNMVLLFQDLLCGILFHFVVYGAHYKSKYLIKYMNVYLSLKPVIEEIFPEYIKSFDKLFFTVMPTVKTYDMKELKIIAEMSEE